MSRAPRRHHATGQQARRLHSGVMRLFNALAAVTRAVLVASVIDFEFSLRGPSSESLADLKDANARTPRMPMTSGASRQLPERPRPGSVATGNCCASARVLRAGHAVRPNTGECADISFHQRAAEERLPIEPRTRTCC